MYIITVGSATPKINKGWPPNIEWIIPQMAVDVNVSTVLKVPPVKTGNKSLLAYRTTTKQRPQRFEHLRKERALPVSLLSCSPKAMTGRAEAKNI